MLFSNDEINSLPYKLKNAYACFNQAVTKTPTLTSSFSFKFTTLSSQFFHKIRNTKRKKNIETLFLRRSLIKDVLSGQSVHVMRMLDSGCDHNRNAVWIRSFQEWIPQGQRYRPLL